MLPEVAAKVEGFADRLTADPSADHNAIAADLVAPYSGLLSALSPLLKRILAALLRAVLAALGE